ncbi:MAG: DUF1822 family protein [Okeania sp. SIO3I5]|uniref:DUF1822 family protein n=1 Tax=Okeania sp. SIO3I5 TaxID=2607805 RepID=UPI0013B890EF|nr:DUF1822 family protein [Okeania sp. SIO3I5]NEQ35382.1 DUF1822 family protein [Okeania sp. SIO3I5]
MNMSNFAQAFKDFYKKKNFKSAYALAKESELEAYHLTKIMRNPILNPTEKTIEKLAKAFADRNKTNLETEKKEIQEFFQEWRDKKSSTGNNLPMNQVQSWSLNLEVTTNDLSEFKENILPDIMAQLENVGEGMIIVKYAKKGSIILGLESSSESYLKVRSSYLNGELSELLGLTVSDLQIQTNLTQWFDNIFTTGWQAANELLTPSQLELVRTIGIKGAKLIDLRADLLIHAVVLLVNLVRENNDSPEVEITLRVYSTGDDVYLPPNLKLIVLSKNEVFKEITARSEDRIIQCQFLGEIGEEFTVQLVLDEAVITLTEDFVI